MRLRTILASGLAACGLTMAGGAGAQSLEEALVAAYANNPTLQSQRATVRAVDEGVPQALSNWRPDVSVSGSYGLRGYHNTQSTGTGKGQHRDERTLSLDVTQPIFRGFRTLAETDRAEALVLAERAQLGATEQDVLLEAVTAYMDVVRDQATLGLNINNQQVLQRQLEATQDRFRVGEITRTDVHQAESRVARAEADRSQAENNLEATRATFHNVVGLMPGELEFPAPPADLPLSKDEAVKRATRYHPNVLLFEFETAAAEHFVEQVRGELLPSLDLTAQAAKNWDVVGEDTRSRNLQAELTLTVPLYQQGAVYSRLREAKQRVAENAHKVDKERRDAREKAMRAWETLDSARARIQSRQAQIRATEVALEGVKREAQVGSRTVLDVLDAEQEVLDAKVSLVEAQRDELVAIFQLKEAMGDLTAPKLGLRVDAYDPGAHYDEVRDKWFGGDSAGQDSAGEWRGK